MAFPGALALALAWPAHAADPAELKPLIDRVLTAYGGESKLRGVQAYVEKTAFTGPDGPNATLVRYVQLPDRLRLESEFESQGKRVKCALVYAGSSGWKHMEGQPTIDRRSPFKGRSEPLRYVGPRAWLRLKDPAYTLTPLGEATVGDRRVFGIGLKPPNDREEKHFFDKESGLLLKVERTLSYPAGKPPVLEETLYSRYEVVDGIPVAREITNKEGGKTTQRIEVVEFRFAQELDARLFQKP
jgi:hypothetical protein